MTKHYGRVLCDDHPFDIGRFRAVVGGKCPTCNKSYLRLRDRWWLHHPQDVIEELRFRWFGK